MKKDELLKMANLGISSKEKLSLVCNVAASLAAVELDAHIKIGESAFEDYETMCVHALRVVNSSILVIGKEIERQEYDVAF